jgi:hypothetical protein
MKIFKSQIFRLSLKIFLIIFFIQPIINTYAWDGYDNESNSSIEIGDDNLVREGNIIEIFDWQDQQSHLVRILSVDSGFNEIEIKVRDEETKKTRTLKMQSK